MAETAKLRWQERAADEIARALDERGINVSYVEYPKVRDEFIQIITEESVPVIDALKAENRRLKIQYDSINKLSDLKQGDIKKLTAQVEAMRPVVECVASLEHENMSVPARRVITVAMIYKARAVIDKMKEKKDE